MKSAEEIKTMKRTVSLIFPHQLYAESPILENENEIYLIEEYLFFKQYKFHKQKIAFHRASMKAFQAHLLQLKKTVHYIEADNRFADMRNFSKMVKDKNVDEVHFIDPTDDYLERRIQALSKVCVLKEYSNPQFINSKEELGQFFKPEKKSFFQTSFYKQQRKKHKILLDNELQPTGGKWTYDSDNRKKYPKGKIPPSIQFPEKSQIWDEAVDYTISKFAKNPGKVSKERLYPINFQESEDWLENFLSIRFHDFGSYEDAIVKDHSFLNHSVLSPLINVGLISPKEVINKSLSYARKADIPLNSLEGFVRQIIGWREFIRGMYVCKGRFSRTKNFWNFNRKIPPSFYDGTTGILPIDNTIKKVLETGYCHHIERLMVLGNFMLLCEFDPDEVYRWFMELFIDAYDWVMVPNVYGMCLFADGGTFATKPYVGGSNYIKKMSNYPKGDWQKTWDGLFWRFIFKNQEFFKSNHRTSMMYHLLNKMPQEKLENHLKQADLFMQNKLEV